MKKENVRAGVPWRLLSFSIIVFIAVLAVYFGMLVGFEPFIKSQLDGIEKKIKDTAGNITAQQSKDALVFYSQMINTQDLLNSRPKTSSLFDFLEKNTLKSIVYTSLNLNYENKKLRLEGKSPSWEAVSQQMKIFQGADGVEKVNLESSRREEKGTNILFSASLNLK